MLVHITWDNESGFLVNMIKRESDKTLVRMNHTWFTVLHGTYILRHTTNKYMENKETQIQASEQIYWLIQSEVVFASSSSCIDATSR
jgi:hypothetical protein